MLEASAKRYHRLVEVQTKAIPVYTRSCFLKQLSFPTHCIYIYTYYLLLTTLACVLLTCHLKRGCFKDFNLQALTS